MNTTNKMNTAPAKALCNLNDYIDVSMLLSLSNLVDEEAKRVTAALLMPDSVHGKFSFNLNRESIVKYLSRLNKLYATLDNAITDNSDLEQEAEIDSYLAESESESEDNMHTMPASYNLGAFDLNLTLYVDEKSKE